MKEVRKEAEICRRKRSGKRTSLAEEDDESEVLWKSCSCVLCAMYGS